MSKGKMVGWGAFAILMLYIMATDSEVARSFGSILAIMVIGAFMLGVAALGAIVKGNEIRWNYQIKQRLNDVLGKMSRED